ncbi:GNAT family N-acetyltransferase [Pradoshia sp. D12]|uniref:GNAT family N-acetyltransferase n=1 Tax=Bacillaceae TaxID=186817 RepID=UPI00080AD59A|nr:MULTISPECIES: GNAT family protein [Bacillaceae]OCA90084.1 GCN5 family acetyltransferase [Bacillus sp. FJAT-27986]QFK70508.1 GNAT family N-acetyltransferase [Pradoshia sp. D12]TPF72303.1 GNAT family N-acetyltransferase [Bacillus sp. D12]
MYKNHELIIRPIREEDLYSLWELVYKEESPEWKKWDAPYFEHKSISYDDYLKKRDKIINQDYYWGIEVDGKIIGTVSYYWEHEPSKWLEMGIGIYNPQYWNGGYGTRALKLWIDHLFKTMPLVRVGYTTWSGNQRMIKVGEKLGMQMEARLRKCRFYDNEYYDSIRMGLLREEWETIK